LFDIIIYFFSSSTILVMTNCSAARLHPRTITFSEYSDLYFINKDDENSATWYSSNDMLQFRKTLVDDARTASQDLQDLPLGDMTHQQLCECLGIETLLFSGVARCIQHAKRAHIAAVLTEQSMQRREGICDIERISRVSQNRSRWTVEKSQKFASACAACVMDE